MTISELTSEVRTNLLRRQDMGVELDNYASHFLKVLCQRVPFEELRDDQNISCTAGSPLLSYIVPIGGTVLAGVVSMQIDYGNNQKLRLKRTDVRNFDATPLPPNGKPTQYARYGLNFEVWPPPDQDYVVRLRFWKNHPIGDPTTTNLLIPEAWNELVRWETYYRALLALGRLEEAQLLVVGTYQPKMPGQPKKQWMTDMGIIPRLWNELLMTISQRENIDEDFGINPVRG